MHLRDGRVAQPRPAAAGEERSSKAFAKRVSDRTTAPAFAEVAFRHLVHILPLVNQELARWRVRAGEISNRELRHTAQQTLTKRGNIEGAALFAVLAPALHRRAAVRALVAFQTAYNFLDGLSELASEDPIADTRRLHEGLVGALRPAVPHSSHGHDDDGYLCAIMNVCSDALAELPSYPSFAQTAQRSAARIVDFQALNLAESHGGHAALQRWALEATPPHVQLDWWETAVSAGSSLAVHALIAASANPGLGVTDACEIERVYFPWVGALHSLLDSLVDRREDRDAGLFCFLDYYDSTSQAADRLASLADLGMQAAAHLPDVTSHRVIATAMCSYYLSAPQCATLEARTVERALTNVLGRSLPTAILMFRSKRRLHAVTDRSYS